MTATETVLDVVSGISTRLANMFRPFLTENKVPSFRNLGFLNGLIINKTN